MLSGEMRPIRRPSIVSHRGVLLPNVRPTLLCENRIMLESRVVTALPSPPALGASLARSPARATPATSSALVANLVAWIAVPTPPGTRGKATAAASRMTPPTSSALSSNEVFASDLIEVHEVVTRLVPTWQQAGPGGSSVEAHQCEGFPVPMVMRLWSEWRYWASVVSVGSDARCVNRRSAEGSAAGHGRNPEGRIQRPLP